MPKFELSEVDEKLTYTNGYIGAILEDIAGDWRPFRYFDNGEIDVSDLEFYLPEEAFEKAKELYT
jgi:hypothetical protein